LFGCKDLPESREDQMMGLSGENNLLIPKDSLRLCFGGCHISHRLFPRSFA
jgi:hypothetical protein